MRTIAVTVCLLVTASAWGQLPPEGPERTKWLDAVLNNWESVMTQVKSLEATCERTTEDKIFKMREVYKGTAKFLKGDGPGLTSRASLQLVKADNPNVYEKLVLSGQFIYEVSPSSKEIRVHDLPKPKPGENVEHNLIALLGGMKAAQAKTRFDIELQDADASYFYLLVRSKTPSDKADFEKAQLALIRTSYMPRRLLFVQANGNLVTWDLPTIQTPAKLRPADFDPPNLPGFKMTRVPSSGPPPNKVRSSGN